jgi:hypothetical protein
VVSQTEPSKFDPLESPIRDEFHRDKIFFIRVIREHPHTDKAQYIFWHIMPSSGVTIG